VSEIVIRCTHIVYQKLLDQSTVSDVDATVEYAGFTISVTLQTSTEVILYLFPDELEKNGGQLVQKSASLDLKDSLYFLRARASIASYSAY